MNIKVFSPKEYFFYAFLAVGAVLFVFLAVLSVNGIKESKYIGQGYEYVRTINVSGQGKVFAKPDIGQVDLSVVTQADTVIKAAAENNDKINKINQAIKELGISEDDLKTISYNINPRYQYLAGKNSIIGYEISQTLQVKIRDLSKISQVLEKSATLGANQVGSLAFAVDDLEKTKEEARQKAIEKAKTKAKELENSLGIRLGRITGFNEYSTDQTGQVSYGIGGAEGKGGGVPTPVIQPGQNEIIINVDLTYEVK